MSLAWSHDNNFLALCGENHVLHVIDRQGKKIFEGSLPNLQKVEDIEWDKDGEIIAIQQENLNFVTLCTLSTKAFSQVSFEKAKDKITLIRWGKQNSVLAIGTEKGYLLLYNKKNQRIIPCLGKHTKKIVTGDWNKEGYLITGGEDKLLTISNVNGDTVKNSFDIHGIPKDLLWSRVKTDERSDEIKHISAIINNSFLILIDTQTGKIIEVNFQKSYGKISSYTWYGDGYIAVGFSNGVIASISTHHSEIGCEIHQKVIFPNMPVEGIVASDPINKIIVASQNSVKFVKMNDWEELEKEKIDLPSDCGIIKKVTISQDGQILVLSTTNGHIFGYLTLIPSLCDSWFGYVGIMTMLSELSIIDCNEKRKVVSRISLEIEPSLVKIGPFHAAIAMANQLFMYEWKKQTGEYIQEKLWKKEYFGFIKGIALSSKWVAVLADGKCVAFLIEQQKEGQEMRFPSNEKEKQISKIELINDFLYMIDSSGKVSIVYLDGGSKPIAEYKPENPIIKIFPNHYGTKAICIDNTGCGILYNPVNDSTIMLPNFNVTIESILLDIEDQNVFITFGSENVQVYLCCLNALEGPQVIHVPDYSKIEEVENNSMGSIAKLESGMKPLIIKNGYLFCLSKTEGLKGFYLPTHSAIENWKGTLDSEENHIRCFLQAIALNRFQTCLNVAKSANIF